ncbi:hypothetical protein [Pantoea graminicola]|uniref:hypothetical protein n=1 Tax=Pantoea sp. ARC607 TaxID=2027922 RepID=UPI001313FFE6|nr:hypothetical protein [Pantoea sp. ARC607]
MKIALSFAEIRENKPGTSTLRAAYLHYHSVLPSFLMRVSAARPCPVKQALSITGQYYFVLRPET